MTCECESYVQGGRVTFLSYVDMNFITGTIEFRLYSVHLYSYISVTETSKILMGYLENFLMYYCHKMH